MMSKPVLVVTGGAGFIGSHLVDIGVEAGFSVRVLDNFSGGREENLALHKNNPEVVVDQRDIRHVEPGDSLFTNVPEWRE